MTASLPSRRTSPGALKRAFGEIRDRSTVSSWLLNAWLYFAESTLGSVTMVGIANSFGILLRTLGPASGQTSCGGADGPSPHLVGAQPCVYPPPGDVTPCGNTSRLVYPALARCVEDPDRVGKRRDQIIGKHLDGARAAPGLGDKLVDPLPSQLHNG